MIELKNISKRYQMGSDLIHALDHVDLTIQDHEFVAIIGPSGSGKSTLMNIVGCLDTPTSGKYMLHGEEVSELNQGKLSEIRSREIGFIFQSFQLLPRLDAQKNVELPLIYAGVGSKERAERAKAMLNRVGLSNKLRNYPNQLSGGQQQRVAIARALVTNPTLLLADEPTGALDQATGRQVLNLFQELNAEGRTIVMITHDLSIAKHARRVVRILDGNLTEGDDVA